MNLSYRISNYALRSIAAVTLPKSMRRSIGRVWIMGGVTLAKVRHALQSWCLQYKRHNGIDWKATCSNLSHVGNVLDIQQGYSYIKSCNDLMKDAALAY